MAATQLSTPFGDFALQRWPLLAEQRLQAWDGADRWLLAHVHEAQQGPEALLLLNDAWGVLATALAATVPACVSCADDYASARAVQMNTTANQTTAPAWLWPDELGQLAQVPGWPADEGAPVQVLARVPRDLALLGEQLQQLGNSVPAGTPVLVAGLDKHLPARLKDHLGQWLSEVQTLHGRFKAHGFLGYLRPGVSPQALVTQPWPDKGIELQVLPGVHARQHLDVGGRLLADQVPSGQGGLFADLGCGSGMLGITVLRQNPAASVVFCDSSAQALSCARLNVAKVCPDAGERARFHHGNGLDGVEAPLDWVLLNPPFHSGDAVDVTVAHMLIRHAARQLVPGGRLLLVCNRHLDYRKALGRHFASAKTCAQNNKFRVIEAVRAVSSAG